MSILTILIPISLVLLGLAIWGLIWAVRSGQFDDLDSPGWRILVDAEPAVEADDPSGLANADQSAGRDES